MYILNGRTDGDNLSGACTCKNVSCIDYFLCSSNILPVVKYLQVHNFCSLLSDAHNPVSLKLNLNVLIQNSNISNSMGSHKRLWDASKVEKYTASFDQQSVDNLISNLSELETCETVQQSDIDTIVGSLNSMFIIAAEGTFGSSCKAKTHQSKAKNPTWYGYNCKRMRRKWHSAKNVYRFNKNEANKAVLNRTSKEYKKTMRQSYIKFKRFNIKKLRNMKSTNPKSYWKIINGGKQEAGQASVENLFAFFKNANSKDMSNSSDPTFVRPENGQSNEQINTRITLTEIEKQIKSLKNNKSSGLDLVMNEHIKSTFHIMGPIYEKLFNIILDSGVLPEVWSVGLIKPIYKQKGEKTKPENYRPITLVSCIGKLFTGILSNRLYTYAENNDIFSNTQAGFRKGHSTTDNIFILYSLIEMLNFRKKKLFCAFIDLKQAFDTVWRDGLWWKLVNCKIDGKCLRLVKNMYSNIKSCLVVNGEQTEFFSCNVGLRQGENLSPFLFAIYLNDLENFFLQNGLHGVVECLLQI